MRYCPFPVAADSFLLGVALLVMIPVARHQFVQLRNLVANRDSKPVISIGRVAYLFTPAADLVDNRRAKERARLRNVRKSSKVVPQIEGRQNVRTAHA